MPVATQASVKTVSSEELERIGYDLILSNAYHLAARPGEDLILRVGGLHKFMSWKRNILTDSGGFQAMSLSKTRKITDEGIAFQSHIDGAKLFLTPQRSVQIQAALGVDISMSLDICPPYPCTRDEAASAMELTHSWAPINLAARTEGQLLFGIVQGGVHEDLRRESAEFISGLPFDGVAIGGVSVGEPKEMQHPAVELTTSLLPDEKPRYLMGVGTPTDIIHAVKNGVDMFDCVLPTRMARHNTLYTLNGTANLLNEKWTEHSGPVDGHSVFPETEQYSAAYLRHLFKANEPLGARLATLHNLRFYKRLMAEIRDAIERNEWQNLEARYANC